MVAFCDLSPLYRAINMMEQKLSHTHGVVMNEAMILCVLKDDSLSSSVISEKLQLPSTHLSKLLRMLESKGFILRTIDKVDKRKMIFTLTECGEGKLKDIGYLSELLYTTISLEVNKLKKQGAYE